MSFNRESNPPSPGHPNLKILSKEELIEILYQHKIWINSKRTKGSQADLRKANLRGASLVGLNLTHANFEEAYLYQAYLKKTNFHSSNFSRVNLRGASLRWANFQKANLKHANLMKADLLNADLRGTDLSGVKNLQCEQINSAIIDQTTKLPTYLKVSWISEEDYNCFLIKE